jgi:hypothetical protein
MRQNSRELLFQKNVIAHTAMMPSCVPICQSYFVASPNDLRFHVAAAHHSVMESLV